jgi:hypothetical protein
MNRAFSGFPELQGVVPSASIAPVNAIPLDAQPYAIAAVLLAAGGLFLAVRLWVMFGQRAAVRRSLDELENHLLRAQRDLALARDDAAEWRAQMQQQFDAFRASSTGQLTAAEARFARLQTQFDESSRLADKTALELRTQAEVLRGMCAELPYARERLRALERGQTEPLLGNSPEAYALAPLPALIDEPALGSSNGLHAANGADLSPEDAAPHADTPEDLPALPSEVAAIEAAASADHPTPPTANVAELAAALALAEKRNQALERQAIAQRIRSARSAAIGQGKAKLRSRE